MEKQRPGISIIETWKPDFKTRTKELETNNTDYSNSKSLLNLVPCVPIWSTCPRACMPAWWYVPACLYPSLVNVPACQRAKSVQTSHFYVPLNVPTCYTICQCFTWRAKVPNGVPIFQLAKRCANFSSIPLTKC